ncbi:hypothetical protein BH23CHL2_BH23CHL2_03910 [soil metagenome]
MIKREESRHDFAFMAGVVIGAVAGALATLALAPRAGTETRERLRSRMQEMPVDDIRARASNLREVAVAGTERIREAAESASASDVVQATRSRVTDLVDRSPLPVKLGDDAGDVVDDAAEAVSEGAERVEEKAKDAGSNLSETADQVIEETTAPAAESSNDNEKDRT